MHMAPPERFAVSFRNHFLYGSTINIHVTTFSNSRKKVQGSFHVATANTSIPVTANKEMKGIEENMGYVNILAKLF